MPCSSRRLPAGPSQWLRGDLPDRIERLFKIPVELVTPPLDLAFAEAVEAAAGEVGASTELSQEAVAIP